MLLKNVLQRVTAFNRDAINLTSGEDLTCGEKINIFSTLRQGFSNWYDQLEKSGKKCKCGLFNHSVLAVF